MAYDPDKNYATGVKSNYCMISGYKFNKLENKVIVEISFFEGTDRSDKKPIEIKTVSLDACNFDSSLDYIESLYKELNKVNPYKDYFDNRGEL